MELRGIGRSALLMAAAVWAVGLSGCSKKPTPESVSTATDTVAVAVDTHAITHDTVAVAVNTLPITYGAITDKRDGKTYKTVVIGGKRWMAENLNYKTKRGSWGHEINECGRLYDWNAAMVACPKGWHLPSNDEWNDLVTATGDEKTAGRKLKSTSGWAMSEIYYGTDDYGFSGLACGEWNYYLEGAYAVGIYGNWWTATTGHNEDSAYVHNRGLSFGNNRVDDYGSEKGRNFSVRCVADAP